MVSHSLVLLFENPLTQDISIDISLGYEFKLDDELSDIIYMWNKFVNLLAILWLIILIMDLSGHLSSVWKAIFFVIWGIFIIDFIIRIIYAKKKILFLKNNLLTLISLAIPAFRILAIFKIYQIIRFISFARGL